jgi:hypothetical protein
VSFTAFGYSLIKTFCHREINTEADMCISVIGIQFDCATKVPRGKVCLSKRIIKFECAFGRRTRFLPVRHKVVRVIRTVIQSQTGIREGVIRVFFNGFIEVVGGAQQVAAAAFVPIELTLKIELKGLGIGRMGFRDFCLFGPGKLTF